MRSVALPRPARFVTARFLVSLSRDRHRISVSDVLINPGINERRSDLSPSGAQRTLDSHQQSLALPELQVSGMRVLFALGFAACSMGALMWLFIRHWLFAL